MLFMSDVTDRYTVKCGCGCYSLTFRAAREPVRTTIHCVICGARAPLASLLAEWRARAARGHRSIAA